MTEERKNCAIATSIVVKCVGIINNHFAEVWLYWYRKYRLLSKKRIKSSGTLKKISFPKWINRIAMSQLSQFHGFYYYC